MIAGLATLLFVAAPLLILLTRTVAANPVPGVDGTMLLLVLLAGAAGSALSIMVRLQDFERMRNATPSVTFFTGFFKPIIGAVFALFVYALLSAGLLPIAVDQDKRTYFTLALAFASGFSERLAPDLATKLEDELVAKAKLVASSGGR